MVFTPTETKATNASYQHVGGTVTGLVHIDSRTDRQCTLTIAFALDGGQFQGTTHDPVTCATAPPVGTVLQIAVNPQVPTTYMSSIIAPAPGAQPPGPGGWFMHAPSPTASSLDSLHEFAEAGQQSRGWPRFKPSHRS